MSLYLLRFLHVDPVGQAYNHHGNEEADYNSNDQLGLVTIVWLVCNKDKTENIRDLRDTFQYETPAWIQGKKKKNQLHWWMDTSTQYMVMTQLYVND